MTPILPLIPEHESRRTAPHQDQERIRAHDADEVEAGEGGAGAAVEAQELVGC